MGLSLFDDLDSAPGRWLTVPPAAQPAVAVDPRLAPTMASAVAAGAALDADPSVQSLMRLLQRTRRAESGGAVATHALHLLCNKVGLTIDQELAMFCSLADADAALVSPS